MACRFLIKTFTPWKLASTVRFSRICCQLEFVLIWGILGSTPLDQSHWLRHNNTRQKRIDTCQFCCKDEEWRHFNSQLLQWAWNQFRMTFFRRLDLHSNSYSLLLSCSFSFDPCWIVQWVGKAPHTQIVIFSYISWTLFIFIMMTIESCQRWCTIQLG